MGQRWGIRRYQNKDGSYTDAGNRRRRGGDISTDSKSTSSNSDSKSNENTSTDSTEDTKPKKLTHREKLVNKYLDSGMSQEEAEASADKRIKIEKAIAITAAVTVAAAATTVAVKNEQDVSRETHQDEWINSNTSLSRIQADPTYNPDNPYYATYTKHDKQEYEGLFTGNLKRRYGSKKVYQLNIHPNEDLHKASIDDGGRVTKNLIKDDEFKSNLNGTISYAKTQMRRPKQQKVLNQAQYYLNNIPPDRMTEKQRNTVYTALNLGMTYHRPDSPELKVQSSFYNAMKNEGFDAVTDLNDKYYSSYHAQKPLIIFNTSKTSLRNAREVNKDQAAMLEGRYNVERYAKEAFYQPFTSGVFSGQNLFYKNKNNPYRR